MKMYDINNHLNSSNSPLVSIIVPVCNTEKYLERCLNSLVFQVTHGVYYEIIAVNDGSTDGSQQILDTYSKKFPNLFNLVCKSHGGPSSARREGMRAAKGEYILFVDSDDWIHPSTLDLLCEQIDTNDVDLVYARYAIVKDNDRDIIAAGGKIEGEGSELKSSIIRNGNMTLWGKLWSKALIIKYAIFPDIWHEDCADLPVLVSYARTVRLVDKPLYFYYSGNDSSITSRVNDQRRLDIKTADKMAWERISQEYLNDWKYKTAIRLVMNLGFTDFYDDMVEYAQTSYVSYGIEDIINELPDDTKNSLLDVLDLNPPQVPKQLVLDGKKADLYSAKIYTDIFNGEYNIEFLRASQDILQRVNISDYEGAIEDYVTIYAVCAYLYENGGFYIGPNIDFSHSLGRLRFYDSVFAFEDATTISHDFIVAKPQAKSLYAILTEFEHDFAVGIARPINQILTNALVWSSNLPIDGNTHIIANNSLVYGIDQFGIGQYTNTGIVYRNLEREHFNTILPSEVLKHYVYENENTILNQSTELKKANSKILQLRRALIKTRNQLSKLEQIQQDTGETDKEYVTFSFRPVKAVKKIFGK